MAWMGQKPDPEPVRPVPAPPAAATSAPSVAPTFRSETREKTEMTQVANIGKSLRIKGELSGNEDLTIEGKIEGKIILDGHSVTIGQNGVVTAEVHAKAVIVSGEVRGNIFAEDKVEVAATGTVRGDVSAPRVVLADGAHIKGSIDMEKKSDSQARPAATANKSSVSPDPSRREMVMAGSTENS